MCTMVVQFMDGGSATFDCVDMADAFRQMDDTARAVQSWEFFRDGVLIASR